MEDVKKVTLITTLYNEEKSILNFLESYRKQTQYAYEFIIVDGGSSDATVEIIEEYALKYVELKIRVIVDSRCSKKYVNGPIARGRNVAIESAKSEYIAITDAGCILDEVWFEEIVDPFKDKNVDIVAGWYKANITNTFQQKFADILMPELESVDRKNFLPSSRSLALKKSCWKSVGGYPTLTYTAEDTQFDLNLKKVGCKFYFAEKAFVYWDVPFNIKEARTKLFSYGYGEGQLKLEFIKNIFKTFFIFFPYHIFLSKQKRKHIYLSYNMFLYNRFGFIKGLFNTVKGKS